jgi:UDP-glucose 4-epimerase
MAMYRLHRGVDARDVAEGHRLALRPSDENYRMFVLSGATPFTREDCVELKASAEHVLRKKCPDICELFAQRNWQLPDSIDRVYDSSLAQSELGWRPAHGFESVVKTLDAQIPEVLPEQARVHQVSE